nr:DEAD/DEAH box helicase [Neobacillus sp. Marseille-Q6967]
MNIHIHHRKIKEMCGTVSFKRGDSFYKADKVRFSQFGPECCEAVVRGTEDFNVAIQINDSGDIQASCSCPTLFSVKYDCQHVAAVLIAISEHQRKDTKPAILTNPKARKEQGLTEGLLSLFTEKTKRSSGHQLHFENREVLDVEFLCKPVIDDHGQYLLAIEMKIGHSQVQDIREFLKDVKNGNPFFLSNSFTYNQQLHCFQEETDAVIQQLIHILDDEKISAKRNHTVSIQQIIFPPSLWGQLLPLLVKAPFVKLEMDGKEVADLQLFEGQLPIQFVLDETHGTTYSLKIKGLKELKVMDSYHTVLSEGKVKILAVEDFTRLIELKQMMDASSTNEIPIPKEQFEFFLEKVTPGLKRLGEVHLPLLLTRREIKTPLTAKLYLDRLKNRLLAGLEFHYGNIVINPLETRELQVGPMLLRDVEKENEILKLMEESSFAHTESGYYLHNEELEYEFLYHSVPKLKKLVQIYATTAVRNRIFRENSFPKIQVKIKKERTNWLEFTFKMAGISDGEIRGLLAALEEKRKYYRVRNGTLLSLESREFNEVQRFLNTLSLPVEDLEYGLGVPVVQGMKLLDSIEDSKIYLAEESFRQFLENIQNPGDIEMKVPPQVGSLLRDYQVYGYKWMKTLASYGFGGILADDMGLGKTLQSITFILSVLSEIREKKLPVLIVCPASLTYNWLSEMMKFAPELEAVIADGDKSERLAVLKEINGADVVITSYPILRKDIEWYEKQFFHTVFFDEAQAFKNPLTQTAKAVKKIKADHRFALTGTPVENSIEELWSIFHIVCPELFQGLKEYSQLSRKKISRRIRPFLLRRLKEDVLAELPEKMEAIDSVELFPEQKKLYAAYLAKLRHDTLKHLDKETIRKNRIKILAGLTRLRQICCHPALFVDGYKGSSAKFDKLLQILEEARLAGRRVLIFSQFTKMLQLIGRELAFQGQSFFYLDGQTPSEERVNLTHRFNAGERNLFLISLKAGGTGLNLTGADTVILYDLWWNPAVEEQAADRAHRMGQTNRVEVIKLVARGTIEEKINELQEKKRNLITEIIDPKEKGVSTLTEEDIREILMI